MNQPVALCHNPLFISSCLKDWEKFGRKNFLTKCKEVGMAAAIKFFTDLLLKLINGDGKIEILSKFIPDFFKLFQSNPTFESKLLDSLWVIDSLVSDINAEPIRDRYFRILEIHKTFINQALLMERLSEETLENLSLIQSKQQFQTRYVRTKTRLFFKQQKFNLLREENEGYAKLITELCQTTGPVDAVMLQVRSLIGYFDLDPNRVLDLILDVCEFREEMSTEFLHLIRLYNPDKSDLTHILGHKFHFTQEPGATTPSSLYKVSALLVWKGLVDLETLYSHLTPSDVDIEAARTRQLNSAKSYKPHLAVSLSLANSAAINTSLNNAINNDLVRVDNANNLGPSLLPNTFSSVNSMIGDDTVASTQNGWLNIPNVNTTNRGIDEEPMQLGEDDFSVHSTHAVTDDNDLDPSLDGLYENNQKLELCTALVRLGDWYNAQRLLDRLPGYWATNYEPLAIAICNFLHCIIEPLYKRFCPLPSCLQRDRSQIPVDLFKALHRPISTNDDSVQDIKTTDVCTTTTSITTAAAASDAPHNTHLYPIDDFNKFARFVIPIAAYLGPFMSCDIVLMVKFCRLGYVHLSGQNSVSETKIGAVYQSVFNLLDEVLLPSLSLVNANCCLSEEVWQVLRFMPYDHRYRLYGQWKHVSGQSEPSLLRRRAQIVCQAKAIMKRLSKENVKPMGRQLGKLSHSNPGLLFDHILSTIQMFTNLIGPVVEALKYVSSLGYDMLTFCIIEALAIDQTKLEDLQLSQGLQALATFTGMLCKKYQFDLVGILQYVLNQLKLGKSYDLSILRDILHRMSGIDISEEMTDEQLESMSGGELLLQEGGYYAQIRNTRKNATRLKDAIIEHNLVMPFIFLMAQQRDAVIFLDDPDQHVKLAGRLYDQCQGTLVQFITFLCLQLTRDEMQAQCLSIDRMMGEFHVPADTAFCLHRSLFEQKVTRLFETKGSTELSRVEKSKSASKTLFAAVSQQVCNELANAIRPLYPPRVWDELGTTFFVTFWSLQSSDLVVPESAYQRQIHQLREQIQQIESTSNPWTSVKKKREIERLENLIDRLSTEQTSREEHVTLVRAWLMTERDNWFQTRLASKTDTITQFLQLCIYPRVCFTAADAIYAAQFMHVLHQLKTARFSTLICLDRIFNDITLPTSMCTEDEAHRYGRFLCAVLELVMRWHSSEEVFNQECGQYPGFVTVFRKTYQGLDANTKPDQLQYENYRHVVHKWHYRITKATVACLESGNYVQIRNALIVLTRILPHYPRITQFGSAVERRVNKLKEEEKDKRPDLKALAFSYAGLMRPRKTKWVSEEEFHLKESKPQRAETPTRTHLLNTRSLHPDQQSNHNPRSHGSSGSSAATNPNVGGGAGVALPNSNYEQSYNQSSSRRSGGSSVPSTGKSNLSSTNPSSEGRLRSQPNNPSQVEHSKSNPTVPNLSPQTTTTSSSNLASTSVTSSKARSNTRPETSGPMQPDEHANNTQIYSSKRRRVETTVASSTAVFPTTSTSVNSNFSNQSSNCNKSTNAPTGSVEEQRDQRKSSARKRSTPTTAAPACDVQTTRYSSSSNTTSPGESASTTAPVTSHSKHHHHHLRAGGQQQQRASSTNSTVGASRETSLDDERALATISANVSKKSKKGHHHHHHHQRTAMDSVNVDPTASVAMYSGASASGAGDVQTATTTRHSRR